MTTRVAGGLLSGMSNEAIVASGPRAIDGWKVPPGGARSQNPEDAIEDAPIIDAGYITRLGRKHHANDAPLLLESS